MNPPPSSIFHWTSVGYDSPLRWWRSSRFLAEKGMGISVGVGLDVEDAGVARTVARMWPLMTVKG